METKPTGLKLLRAPFPDNQISLLPKPYKKDSEKGKCTECGGYHGLPAVHLKYVGHAALTDRLLDADEAWSWKPVGTDENGLPAFDKNGGLWIELTVCGVSRLGYGNAPAKSDPGAREKEVIGDALRNAAMRFGAALDLWHKGDLHAHHDDSDEPMPDNQALKKSVGDTPKQPVSKPTPAPKTEPAKKERVFNSAPGTITQAQRIAIEKICKQKDIDIHFWLEPRNYDSLSEQAAYEVWQDLMALK